MCDPCMPKYFVNSSGNKRLPIKPICSSHFKINSGFRPSELLGESVIMELFRWWKAFSPLWYWRRIVGDALFPDRGPYDSYSWFSVQAFFNFKKWHFKKWQHKGVRFPLSFLGAQSANPEQENCDHSKLWIFFFFLGPNPQHVEVPRLSVEWFGAAAAGLHHGHSNTRSKPPLRPMPQLVAASDP